MKWIRAPAAAIRAISPEQPIASSSAWGAMTSAEPGSSGKCGRADAALGAQVAVRPVERRGLGDQGVEADLGPPADRGRRALHGQLLQRLRLLVERAVDLACVAVFD